MDIRIGILECDHVNPELRNEYDDYHEMFADLVQSQDSAIEFCTYDLIADSFPVDIHACDAYIITGSKFGVYENILWINQAKQLVRRLYEAKIPTIGICFGHQLIAEALGGKVIKATEKGRGLGVQTWEVTGKKKWMGDVTPNSLALNACHQDQVIKMPKNSELMITSEFCPIAGFQTNNMLGIQGHPEFDHRYTNYLFEKYKDTLNSELKEKTINSLKNSQILMLWGNGWLILLKVRK